MKLPPMKKATPARKKKRANSGRQTGRAIRGRAQKGAGRCHRSKGVGWKEDGVLHREKKEAGSEASAHSFG